MPVHLVSGGRWHDFDYARTQLLGELAGHGASVIDHRSWPEPGALSPADVLLSYTCDLRPDPRAQQTLVEFVEGGGRWLALHATNSALDPPQAGAARVFQTPRVLGAVAPLLGSQFLAHPPMAPYRVEITAPDHPLVRGLEPFETRDELYVSELHGPLEVLLHARFRGPCPSFAENDLTGDDRRPVLYLRGQGAGEVVYFTLGHCRSVAELHDLGKADATEDDHGSWELPAFRTVLQRCLAYVLTPGSARQ